MNQIKIHSDQQDFKIDSLKIVNFLQFACASGFAKNYGNRLDTKEKKIDFLKTVDFMIADLSQEQLQAGVLKLRDSGFCPDLNLFRRWCLGLTGFDTAEDAVRKTYLGSDSALAHIVSYRKGESNFITNAMELAYRDVMPMFIDLDHVEKPEFLLFQVYKSFKSCYENHVEKLVSEMVEQSALEVKLAIKMNEIAIDAKNIASSVSHRPFG